MPALSTPRCSGILGACVPSVGPTPIMAAASQPMEAGDAEDAIPLTQPMFDGDATDDDPPAPRLVVTDDAEACATVPSHELPVPEVGDAIVVLGRATLAQALATKMAADDNTFGAAACTARLSATGRPNAATTQLATTCSAWRTVTCAKAGISVAASPRPSVDRLDMGWGALETLASQPLARAREERSGSPRGAVTLPRVGGAGVGCACAGGACGAAVRAHAGGCVRLHHVRR